MTKQKYFGGFRFFIFIFSILFWNAAEAAAKPADTLRIQKLYAGLDIGKTIFANASKEAPFGFTAEGLLRLENPSGFNILISAGYSRFARPEPYTNTRYLCRGFFGKAGIETHFSSFIDPRERARAGLSVVVSRFTNSGDFFIPGDFFPEYRQGYSVSGTAAAVQPYFCETLLASGRIRLEAMVHASWIFTPVKDNGTDQISYYMPGVGIHRDGKLSCGLSLQLFYAF